MAISTWHDWPTDRQLPPPKAAWQLSSQACKAIGLMSILVCHMADCNRRPKADIEFNDPGKYGEWVLKSF
jgi:hypothetical protein